MTDIPRKTCVICGRTAEAGPGVVVTGGGHWVCLDGPCHAELMRREAR